MFPARAWMNRYYALVIFSKFYKIYKTLQFVQIVQKLFFVQKFTIVNFSSSPSFLQIFSRESGFLFWLSPSHLYPPPFAPPYKGRKEGRKEDKPCGSGPEKCGWCVVRRKSLGSYEEGEIVLGSRMPEEGSESWVVIAAASPNFSE